MFIIGLDVHKIHTQACILGENGEVRESRLSTARDQFETVFGSMEKSRILLESSTESEWVARCLEGLGHTVIVADPNYAPMYGQRSRRVKTDKRDSRALAGLRDRTLPRGPPSLGSATRHSCHPPCPDDSRAKSSPDRDGGTSPPSSPRASRSLELYWFSGNVTPTSRRYAHEALPRAA